MMTEIDVICGMKVDKNNSLETTLDGTIYYFCSQHCLDKFRRENNIIVNKTEEQKCQNSCESEVSSSCCSGKKRLFYIFVVLVGIVGISYLDFFKFLNPFRLALFNYGKIVWLPVLLGFLISGIIDAFVPATYIAKILTKHNKYSIIHSVFLGFLMSACNHGILAITIQLYKKGASIPEIITFLLASPWANLPLTILFFSFFGFKSFFIIISAMVIAVITGYAYKYLDKKNWIEKNKNTVELAKDFSIIQDIKVRHENYKFTAKNIKSDIKNVWEGSLAMSDMILWWLIIGVVISSAISAYIPQHIFHHYLGANMLGLLLTLAGATIIEVCSEGSAAIAFEIYNKTAALGNSFVFLMAGVATDYTEIGLLWANVGKKTALWLPAITVPQVVLIGMIANKIF